MKPFPKIHDLYVARVLLGTVLLTWAVLIGLDVIMAVVTELNDVGTGHYRQRDRGGRVERPAPRLTCSRPPR